MVQNSSKWKILESKVVFSSLPWIRLTIQNLRLPDGRIVDDYPKLELRDYSMIFAETNENKIILERSYKHGFGNKTLVCPAGGVNPGENPLDTAKRELLEETGYKSDNWISYGQFVVNGNYGCGKANIYKASKCFYFSEPINNDLEDMDIKLFDIDELKQLVFDGQIKSLSSIMTISLATNQLFNDY